MRNLRSEQEIMAMWKGDTSEPLVSINCITYNHEPYIEDALEGFLIQETDFPFEILIHDDASTDRTADIIREYEADYPNLIKPIYQTDNRYSKGIKISATYQFPRALGKYIAMCEGDDYWTDPLKLQKQVDILETSPEHSLCFHNGHVYNIDSGEAYTFNKKLSKRIFNVYDVILKSWFIPTASIVYRNTITFPDWKDVSGDIVIIILSALQGSIYYLDETLCVRRYGTPYSLSKTTPKMKLYYNKYMLLKQFDKHTNHKYFFFTSMARIKLVLSICKNGMLSKS